MHRNGISDETYLVALRFPINPNKMSANTNLDLKINALKYFNYSSRHKNVRAKEKKKFIEMFKLIFYAMVVRKYFSF